ncbi:hypothetical protein CK203_061191 [Vitis vinifera]|uniref:Uncharacterized protein n=1 Tax=Vitis vinifera TaxID=29760 RepID=A0A438GFZ2_VITVI|nr:hypothetical protein CK203_061191 [Vitis vinifera]
MCGGDDHLAWKCPVSSKACRGLHTAGGIGSSFSVWIYHLGLEYRGAQYLVLHTLQDWFFILSVDLSSWCIKQLRVSDSSSTWDDLDSILVPVYQPSSGCLTLRGTRALVVHVYSSSTLQYYDEGPWVRRVTDDHHVSLSLSGATHISFASLESSRRGHGMTLA